MLSTLAFLLYFLLNYSANDKIINVVTYNTAHIAKPTIPHTKPAFADLLCVFLIPITPVIIANIPQIAPIYHMHAPTIEMIPNTNDAMLDADDTCLFSSIIISS